MEEIVYLTFFTFVFLMGIVNIFDSLHNINDFKISMKKISDYNPNICTIKSYKFAFLFDDKTKTFKVHGIWPESCEECLSCGYPTCCNVQDIIYTDPIDSTNFIKKYWYNTTAIEPCYNNNNKISLFTHEYFKHISCTNIKNTTDFLDLVIYLYDLYYDKIYESCEYSKQLIINLDKNYYYQSVDCLK
jgi:hypothetical protein